MTALPGQIAVNQSTGEIRSKEASRNLLGNQSDIFQIRNQQSKWCTVESHGVEVDVWFVCLIRDSSEVHSLYRTLSADERRKASNFRFTNDRERYVVARGSLRKILATYIDDDPARICFSYGRHGKPFLDSETERLHFNVSHSKDFALIAVALGADVGADIEFIDDDLDVLSIAGTIFSDDEMLVIEELPEDLRTSSFFSAWTRKEAYLKALGTGFSDSHEEFHVPAMIDESKISYLSDESEIARAWTVMTIPSVDGYAASVAVCGEIEKIRHRSLSEVI